LDLKKTRGNKWKQFAPLSIGPTQTVIYPSTAISIMQAADKLKQRNLNLLFELLQ